VEEEVNFNQRQKDAWGIVDCDDPFVMPFAYLSRQLGNLVICRKGLVDVITDGEEACYVTADGSMKRCGGIGDILAGTIGTFSQYKELAGVVDKADIDFV
jgi:hydroxyethylthiazole kinase-like sugar kinase family protein